MTRSGELLDALRDPNHKTPGSPAMAIARAHGCELYHLRHLAWAIEFIGFKRHRVLEVGGSLPQGLINEFTEAESWISLEYLPYYDELGSSLGKKVVGIMEIERISDVEPGTIISGAAEAIPYEWAGAFDSIFSVACFEHINALPLALQKMGSVLNSHRINPPENCGRLYSGFAPIWSSATGYHMSHSEIPDQSCLSEESPFFDYMHLLLRPVELYKFLLPRVGETNASAMVYHIHHSNHINRYFIEDFVQAVKQVRFNQGHIESYARRSIDPKILSKLEAFYPKNKGFDFDGLLIRLVF